MKRKLTQGEVKALCCPQGKHDCIVFDNEIAGFGVRVTAAGAKTFVLQYVFGGRRARKPRGADPRAPGAGDSTAATESGTRRGQRERLILGRYGQITVDQARARAHEALGVLGSGRNPALELLSWCDNRPSRPEADDITFAALIDAWADKGLASCRPRYRAEAPAVARRTFASLLGQFVHQIDRKEVRGLVNVAAERHPIGTRRAVSYARAAFNWAIDADKVQPRDNPFRALLRGKEASRKRVLSNAELGEAWRGAATLPAPFGPFLQLLILTLQRRSEVAGMRWDELAPDLSTWTIPAHRAKNGEAHLVHLTEAARVILRALPRVMSSPFVFPAVRRRARPASSARVATERRPVSGFSDTKERLIAKIREERAKAQRRPIDKVPLPDWRLHDLRRTGVTAMARCGVAWQVADRILNHVHGQGAINGVAAVYQMHDYLIEREAAMRIWADHVLDVAVGTGAGENVIPLQIA